MIVKLRKDNKCAYKLNSTWKHCVPEVRYKLISVDRSLAKLMSVDNGMEIFINIIDLITWMEEPFNINAKQQIVEPDQAFKVFFKEDGTTSVLFRINDVQIKIPALDKESTQLLGSVLDIGVEYFMTRTIVEATDENYDKSKDYRDAVKKYKKNAA